MSDQNPCNCPTPTQLSQMLSRGEGMGTKPPCPIHDTLERLAALASSLQPRIDTRGLAISAFEAPDPEQER